MQRRGAEGPQGNTLVRGQVEIDKFTGQIAKLSRGTTVLSGLAQPLHQEECNDNYDD
jgi:hypothetical protein